MQLTWLTDIHINFVSKEDRLLFYQSIKQKKSDALLISGDIAEAPSVSFLLQEMADSVDCPIYFVLGNHDYYHGQVREVRDEMLALTQAVGQLNWLPATGLQQLSPETILVGQDGWADGRCGDYANSTVRLNDCRMIADLFASDAISSNALLEKMQQLADEDAKQLMADLTQATQHTPKRIFILTHVPPFREACLYQGKISGDDFLPFFASKATGDVLVSISEQNTDIDFVVLCGHTHGQAFLQYSDNLTVKVGGAEYLQPEIQETFTV